MARTGLYKSEVKKARDALIAQGRHPSVDAVRVELGNTGSKSTIHKYLKELEAEYGGVDDRKASISEALHDLVARLAIQLEVEANERIGEVQLQSTEKERQLNASIAALNAANEALSDKLSIAEARTQSEVAAHARTAESLQRETIARHTLEQQVIDLKERLLENEGHRQSLEAKHTHAREALEHYRESAKEQRDQDIRRHEHQVQQLQGEIRHLQQSLVHKQNEITALNQDGARLVAELSQAQKSIYDLQGVERKHISDIESLKVTASRIILLESESTAKDIAIGELRSQLTEISTQAESLKSQLHEKQLELVKSLAIVETHKTMMADLQGHLGISKSKNE
ncbi:DNA-binding protein [Undibacterium fentianense]|uniref:DNA-binding protein n=1 Tax=Undibacterium fentianense TaxID=2828728 RepID=A0A941E2L0_9BURK|nr:DNA-binding protein [Undibacterium fentianense]MBR7798538.1 DNA-binding protein [Undibacterium fentianense]